MGFNVLRNGSDEGASEDQGGDFSGVVAVTRTLMNELGLHAALVDVTHTAAGYAALIGRASRRVCGSFAKRSAYMRLGDALTGTPVDFRCSRAGYQGVCAPREQLWLRLADFVFNETTKLHFQI